MLLYGKSEVSQAYIQLYPHIPMSVHFWFKNKPGSNGHQLSPMKYQPITYQGWLIVFAHMGGTIGSIMLVCHYSLSAVWRVSILIPVLGTIYAIYLIIGQYYSTPRKQLKK